MMKEKMGYSVRMIIIIILLFTLILTGSGEESAGEEQKTDMSYIGGIGGQYKGLALEGDYLYATCVSGLRIIDVSSPSQPEEVGFLKTDGYASSVVVDGDFAYVADDNNGLLIIDVSDPSDLVIVGQFQYESGDAMDTRDVVVLGNFAYIADGSKGLSIINITDKSSPELISTFDTSRALSLSVSGNFVYLADESQGLLIIDISNMYKPIQTGKYETGDQTRDVVAIGDLAYVVDSTKGFFVIDVSNRSDPVLEGKCDIFRFSRGISIDGNYAYVAQDSYFKIVDISDPDHPSKVGSYDTFDWTYDAVASGEYAYVSDGSNGILIFDVSAPDAPSISGHFGYETFFSVLSGERVLGTYYDNGEKGIVILSLEDISNPSIVNRCEVPGDYSTIRDFCIDGETLYLQNDSLVIMDISDIDHPSIISELSLIDDGYSMAIEKSGSFVYVTVQEYGTDPFVGLMIIDVSNRENPIMKGNCDIGYLGEDIAFIDNYAYVIDRFEGIFIIDISDPDDPQLVHHYDSASEIGYSSVIEISGNYAYLSTTSFVILDITERLNPKEIGGYHGYSSAWDVGVTGTYAYSTIRTTVSSGDLGIQFYNINNRSNPISLGYYVPAGGVSRIIIPDEPIPTHVYISGSGGFAILQLRPIAYIDEVTPQLALDSDLVRLEGHGTGHMDIQRYRWRSDLDGILYEGPNLVVDVGDLTIGDHTIFFSVQDTSSIWSKEVSATLEIREIYADIETIIPMYPDVALKGDEVEFFGAIRSSSAVEYFAWTSDIDGEIYNGSSDHFTSSTLSLGTHTITFSAKNINGAFAESQEGILVIQDIESRFKSAFGGYFRDVHISEEDDQFMYIGRGSGLYIYDISIPSSPVEIGYAYAGGTVLRVWVAGDYAYLACEYGGLVIIDVYDKANPVKISHFDTGSRILSVRTSGNFAYVGDSSDSLLIIDITDRARPVLKDQLKTNGYGYGLDILDGRLYLVTGYDAEIMIFDIANPATPVLLKEMVLTGTPWDIAVVDTLAYIADTAQGLSIIDISNPMDPTIIGSVETKDAYAVTISGDIAYVADGYDGVAIVDISDPTLPEVKSQYDTLGTIYGIAHKENLVYAAVRDREGFIVLDVSNTEDPQPIDQWNASYHFDDIEVVGTYAFGAAGRNGMLVVDITDRDTPFVRTSYSEFSRVYDIEIIGTTAYLAAGSGGFGIVDISDPASPLLIGACDTNGSAEAFTIVGDYAYIADHHNGLVIVDITDPADPVIVGEVDTKSYAYSVDVHGEYAYIAGYSDGL